MRSLVFHHRPLVASSSRTRSTPRAEPASSNGLSEDTLRDVLAKLAAAEAEAAALRSKLDEAPPAPGALDGLTEAQLARRKPAPLSSGLRIDSSTGRLGAEGSKGAASWLSESDISTFLARGPGEAAASGGGSGVAAEDMGTLTRRLAIGAASVLLFGVLALRPDTAPPPPKPLFLYLTPLVRSRGALSRAEEVVANADWPGLAALRASVLVENEARANFAAAAAALPTAKEQESAKALASSCLEYVAQADFEAYFDTRAVPTPSQNAEFVVFAGSALKAAEAKLDAFLALFPGEALEAARAGAVQSLKMAS